MDWPGASATSQQRKLRQLLAGDLHDWARRDRLRVCPDNSSSYFIPRTACQCDKGFKCASGAASCDDGACVQCEANTYKDVVGGAAACTDCQANSESPAASIVQSACQCSRGYEQDGPETCVACEGGEYSDELDTETCSVCKDELPHTYTPSSEFPYDEQSACTPCTLCAQGSFFDTEGWWRRWNLDIACKTCLTGLVTGAQAYTRLPHTRRQRRRVHAVQRRFHRRQHRHRRRAGLHDRGRRRRPAYVQ